MSRSSGACIRICHIVVMETGDIVPSYRRPIEVATKYLPACGLRAKGVRQIYANTCCLLFVPLAQSACGEDWRRWSHCKYSTVRYEPLQSRAGRNRVSGFPGSNGRPAQPWRRERSNATVTIAVVVTAVLKLYAMHCTLHYIYIYTYTILQCESM